MLLRDKGLRRDVDEQSIRLLLTTAHIVSPAISTRYARYHNIKLIQSVRKYCEFFKDLLEELWKAKSELVFEQGALFALIASEMANGDITKRGWAAYTTNEVLLLCILYSLTNSFYLFFRITEAGARQEPVIRAFSYLLLVAVHRAGAKTVSTLINNIFNDFHGKKLPSELRNFILEPVINTLTGEIRDVCTHDCSRVSTDPSTLTKPEIKNYWKRLRVAGDEEEKDDRILTIECFSNPCRFGLATGDKKHCPICFLENPEKKLSTTLKTVEILTKAHLLSAEGLRG